MTDLLPLIARCAALVGGVLVVLHLYGLLSINV